MSSSIIDYKAPVYLFISDHRPVSFEIKTMQYEEVDKINIKKYYKDINWLLFKKELSKLK